MKEWTYGRLINPFNTINIAFLLRLRLKNVIQSLNLEQEDRASQIVQHITSFIAIVLICVELYVFFTTGQTLPLPSLIYQALSESYSLLYIFILLITGKLLLKKWEVEVPFSLLFYCSCYAILSYLYWLLVIVIPISWAIDDLNISRALRNALLIDTGMLFFYMLKVRGYINFESDKEFSKKMVFCGIWFSVGVFLIHLLGVLLLALIVIK